MKPKTIVILSIFVIFIIILLQNTQTVTFQLLFWTLEMSRIIILILMLLLGFVLGYLTAKLKKSSQPK